MARLCEICGGGDVALGEVSCESLFYFLSVSLHQSSIINLNAIFTRKTKGETGNFQIQKCSFINQEAFHNKVISCCSIFVASRRILTLFSINISVLAIDQLIIRNSVN